MRTHTPMIIAAAVLALTPAAAPTQTAAPMAGAPIVHVALAVRNIESALQTLGGVLGFSPGQPLAITVPTPDGRKLPMKVANTSLSNFLIELDQATGGASPTQDFIDRYGQGIQHIGVSVKSLEPPTKALVQLGGRWTLGVPGGSYAFVDLMPTLGMTIDLTNQTPTQAAANRPPGGLQPGGLASYPVVHLTYLSTDADATAKAFADAFGVAPSAARVMKPVYYPPGSKASPSAHLKTVELRPAGMTVVIAEPIGGPSPGADFLARRKGPGAYSVAFDVGDKVDEMVRALQAKGGKWTLGRAGSGYAWVDFTDSLGLVIELRGRGK